jgi:kinesin family protein 20
VVSIESDYQIAVSAPPDSAAYKNSINGAGKLTHRYTFTKIFPPTTEQSELFNEMVLPRLKDFLEGTNQLVFTYGATCSGKTFTIQGDSSQPGILPRALDVLFNSICSRQIGSDVSIKPLGYNRVANLVPREAERVANEKKAIFELGKELKLAMESSSRDLNDDSQASIVSLKSRVKDETTVDLKETSLHFAVWVSFAEIYNENIYDLLEKVPEVKNKGDKPRRSPLKLSEDRGNLVYIKGLKEVSVHSADEAYQLLMIGRENLQFAATRLNHNSSRSHCIFTVKVVRVANKDQPHLARVSMLSFCDLAGSERIKKTLNTGERQKEAGNINTSLLVLGRCIKAIRHNQVTKDVKKHQIVPFRDSKLTRLFQSYFTGLGKASMVVNVSQSPYLFDESLQVLKFSAIASKVECVLIEKFIEFIEKKIYR